jgi:hypothetical protein
MLAQPLHARLFGSGNIEQRGFFESKGAESTKTDLVQEP